MTRYLCQDVEDAPVEDPGRLASVHVPSHTRQRQRLEVVMTFASVSIALPWQNGHLVGRAIAWFRCASDIVPFAPWRAGD